MDCFHCGGMKGLNRRVLKRCWRWVLFTAVRFFFCILVLMRSVPTALLFDLGRQRSISSVVMWPLKKLFEVDRILVTMASCSWGLGGMMDGNTLLKCSAKISDFLRGSFICVPSMVMLVPSGDWFTPLPDIHSTKDHSLGWSWVPRLEMKVVQAFLFAVRIIFFFLASARLHSDISEEERGELRHFLKALRAARTAALQSSFHHGRQGSSHFCEVG